VISNGVVSGSASAGIGSQFRVPAGPGALLLANAGTASVIYVGAGTAVTTSNGFPVVSGAQPPVVIPLYPGAPGQVWSCITAGGTGELAWIASTAAGGTGP